MVDLALKMLLHDKLRFAITVSGVAFAVALVLIQVGLFIGLLDNAKITIDNADADLWVTSKGTPNVDFAHAFPENRVQRVRSIPGVEAADNLIVTFVNVALPNGAEENMILYALSDFRRWGLPWNIVEGAADDLRRGPFMLLDDSATQRFGPFAVGEQREVFGRRLKIVGRTREAKSFTTTPIAFVDYDLAQEINPSLLAGNTTYVLVKLAKGADTEAVRHQIARRLPFNDVYTRAEWAARCRRYWLQNTGLGVSMFMTVFLGCLVGVIVVAQTLYASTMEHIREFGTVKAIGGSNADIYRILMRQAGVAALVGYVCGVIPSVCARPVVAATGLRLVISPSFALIVFAGAVGLCAVAAAFSFHKVASIDPGLVFRG
jgi:putative ABC transport system permease protein